MRNFIQKLKWFGYTVLSASLIYAGNQTGLEFLVKMAILYVLFYKLFFRKEMFLRKVPHKQKRLPELSLEQQAVYEDAGLTPQDVKFFRKKMNQVKKQIQQVELLSTDNSKFQVILNRYNTLPLMKGYFQQIVRYPQRLHEANSFINTLLPSLVEIMEKYTEIFNHLSKTTETYQVLEETAEVIEQLCQQLEADYLKFTRPDFDELAVETQYLKQHEREEFEDF